MKFPEVQHLMLAGEWQGNGNSGADFQTVSRRRRRAETAGDLPDDAGDSVRLQTRGRQGFGSAHRPESPVPGISPRFKRLDRPGPFRTSGTLEGEAGVREMAAMAGNFFQGPRGPLFRSPVLRSPLAQGRSFGYLRPARAGGGIHRLDRVAPILRPAFSAGP